MNPKHVTKFMGLDSEGNETGTVNLGYKANYDIWAKVYDKRHERLSKGFPDCGQMLRIEIAIQSDVGATLRDISNPHDIYYQYASKSLVQAPSGFKGWVSHAMGLSLEKNQKLDLTTWERLWGIAQFSDDLKRMIDLAIADYGDSAEAELNKLIRKRVTLVRKGIGLTA